MMKVPARAVALGLLLSAAVLAGTSLAWACTPNAFVAVSPGLGAAGERATVTLRLFYPDKLVHVRLEGDAGSTPLTTIPGPNGSSTITLPDVPGGMYSVVGEQFDEAGNVIGQSRASFEVMAPADTGGSGDTDTAPQPPPRFDGSTGRDGTGSSPESAPVSTEESSSAVQPAPQSGSVDSLAPTRNGSLERSTAASEPSASYSAHAGRGVGIEAPSSEAATTNVGAVPDPLGAGAGGVSSRSAGDDLWSGFSDRGRRTVTGPSLSRPLRAADDDGNLALGLGLLTVGLVSLASGFCLSVRRARAFRR